ncbi:hypothetical protein LIER_28473 [Lithospermum erythrorhizon]|uniref:Uncharacterized protein n=1 Tax=Lithospermum erythrorhizon TaxID=34254 RepID=A0AAV3RJ53_LITER
MEINSVKVGGDEEDHLPKERESEKRVMPHEDLVVIPFKDGNNERTFKIGSKLGQSHQEQLIKLIREFEDVSAWGPEDMLRIDPSVALHKLYVDPNSSPMKQKKRLSNNDTAIREEVQALLKGQAIRDLKFPVWVTYVVLVKTQ